MSDDACFESISTRLTDSFGQHTTIARAKESAKPGIMKAISKLPMNATTAEIAAVVDSHERENLSQYRKPSEQEQFLHDREVKAAAGKSAFGVPKADLANFSAAERLALANSGGATLPAWYRIQKSNGGAQ